MHQDYKDGCAKPSKKDELLGERSRLLGVYRNAVVWSCKVLDYKRRFDREEDFQTDGLCDHIEFLKEDSRRELKDISLHIKSLRKRIDDINNRLMDLAKGS